MKLVDFYRRPISVFVMVVFAVLLCSWAGQAPAAPAAGKGPAATPASGDVDGTGFIEQEQPEHAAKKGKKFPWLIVAAAVAVGGVALYFLVLKKTKYELTVTLGAGATGTPATGSYKKGAVVAYSFSALAGYGNLQVMLDGRAVAASGSVTMDRAHALAASATQGAVLQVNSTPSGARIYLDGADSGFTTPHAFSYPAAVTKALRLHYASCGYLDYSQTVNVPLGFTITVDAVIPKGIHEDFNTPASSCWLSDSPSQWTTVLADGHYRYKGKDDGHFFNFFNFPFSGDYTLTVKMNLEQGHGKNAGLFLGENTSVTQANGYMFSYGDGYVFDVYQIYRVADFNFLGSGGTITSIKFDHSSAIKIGVNHWNTLKIVKTGSHFIFYINNVLLHSFDDATHDPQYFALTGYTHNYPHPTRMLYDYVYLTQ